MNGAKLRFKAHEPDELAHYAKRAEDLEYEFPFGWQEVEGVHNRTDYDLSRHEEHSGKKLQYLDPVTNDRFLPYVIETALGVGRLFLAIMADAYREEEIEGDKRVVMGFQPSIAPIKVGVFPLVKKDGMPELARTVYDDVRKRFRAFYDEKGAIGRRYRRQDEAGTPFGVTIDGESVAEQTITVRDRDTLQQERIGVDQLANCLCPPPYRASRESSSNATKTILAWLSHSLP